MRQSRSMSLVESLVNVAVGLHVALVTQVMVFPLFGLKASLADNLSIAAVFTLASIARSYALRRLFEAIRVVGAGRSSRRHDPDQSAFADTFAGAAKR